jgi:NitT/TauT family transport system substrate-binding protein
MPSFRATAASVLAAALIGFAIAPHAAAEGAGKPRTPLSPPVKVTLGTIGSASDVGFFIAQERGYFAAEGLEVKFEFIGSAVTMLPSLATGSIHVASGGIGAGLINAIHRGIAVRIVADKGTLYPGSSYQALLLRKDVAPKVRRAADLKGLKIATSGAMRTIDGIIMSRLAISASLGPTDIQIVDLVFPDMVTALATGAIDGALIIEPFATTAIDQGSAVLWKSAAEIMPNIQIAGVYYGPKFIEAEPEAAKRFMVAYLRAIRDYNDEFLSKKNMDPIIAVLTKYTRIKDPAVYRRITPPSIGANAEMNLDSLKEFMAVWKEHKLIPEIDADKIVDDQYLRYAWDQLGRR